ncbi:MAG TPA: hypothetical protein DIV86_06450 [Alphaproteobacteria bacterium]|nr:hypothetical protein [Alphaproteobacteria bacterium]
MENNTQNVSTIWDILTALGTVGSCIIALFFDKFKNKFFPPKLELEIDNIYGELTEKNFPAVQIPSRYYHLKVTNKRRWVTAKNVQIILRSVEKKGVNGNWIEHWRGDIPFMWRHENIRPVSLNVGPSYTCDLCDITKNRGLTFHLKTIPNNFVCTEMHGEQHYKLLIEAISDEKTSKTYEYIIDWDGLWEDGEKEMSKHFSIKQR